jgi:hypothetical protein
MLIVWATWARSVHSEELGCNDRSLAHTSVRGRLTNTTELLWVSQPITLVHLRYLDNDSRYHHMT